MMRNHNHPCYTVLSCNQIIITSGNRVRSRRKKNVNTPSSNVVENELRYAPWKSRAVQRLWVTGERRLEYLQGSLSAYLNARIWRGHLSPSKHFWKTLDEINTVPLNKNHISSCFANNKTFFREHVVSMKCGALSPRHLPDFDGELHCDKIVLLLIRTIFITYRQRCPMRRICRIRIQVWSPIFSGFSSSAMWTSFGVYVSRCRRHSWN